MTALIWKPSYIKVCGGTANYFEWYKVFTPSEMNLIEKTTTNDQQRN